MAPLRSLGRDFSAIWVGQASSKIGSHVAVLAVPVVAIVFLDADSLELGVLFACSSIAFLLVGLPAGAWVDRMNKRRVMIVADVVRLLSLLTIPLAFAFGFLSIWLLCLVTLVQGICAVFFDVAYRSILPAFVPTNKLLAANSRLEVTSSAATAGGPALAGLVIDLLRAPTAVIVNALTFAVSAGCTASTRFEEQPRKRLKESSFKGEIVEGLRLVFSDSTMRAIVGASGVINFSMGAFYAVAIAFLVRDLALSVGSIGLLMSGAGAGGVLGAVVAGWITTRLGVAHTLRVSVAVGALFLMLAPLSGPGVNTRDLALSHVDRGSPSSLIDALRGE
jgi:MFS family permease